MTYSSVLPSLSPSVRSMGMVFSLLVGLLLSSPAHARRGGFVLYSSGDTITEVADLPDDGPTGEANVGWMHYQFSLFWMPLWSGEGSYVLYQETANSYDYQDITEEQALELGTAAGVDVSPPGLFSLYWGWGGLLGILVALGIFGMLPGGDDD